MSDDLARGVQPRWNVVRIRRNALDSFSVVRRAAKVDRNHGAVRDAFRSRGFAVADTHQMAGGYPDLTISRDMITALVEVKMPGEKLTKDQVLFHGAWKGRIYIVVDPDRDVEQISRHWLKEAL
jgi:hypothetical protein